MREAWPVHIRMAVKRACNVFRRERTCRAPGSEKRSSMLLMRIKYLNLLRAAISCLHHRPRTQTSTSSPAPVFSAPINGNSVCDAARNFGIWFSSPPISAKIASMSATNSSRRTTRYRQQLKIIASESASSHARRACSTAAFGCPAAQLATARHCSYFCVWFRPPTHCVQFQDPFERHLLDDLA